MAEIDPRVTELNASITRRWERYASTHGHLPEVAALGATQRTFMTNHQPEGGQWGAPCRGSHDAPTNWPCDGVLKFDNPLAYMD